MPLSPYQEARLRTRALMGRLTHQQARNIRAALDRYLRGIERELTASTSPTNLNRLRHIINAQARQLEKVLQSAIAENRDLVFGESLEVWERGGLEYASARGVNPSEIARLRSAPVTMIGAFESLSAAGTWKTMLHRADAAMAAEVNAIVTNGLIEGIGPDELARRMRKYVLGGEPFQKAFRDIPTPTGVVSKLDLRTLDATARGAAGQMVFNAERIAFSEIHNARAEAEIQHFVQDPFVTAVRWRLSPDRGSLGGPDECDYLAESDFYGLGPGVYPVDEVPAPPHPFDRCERDPITRETSKIDQPKPKPPLTKDPRDPKMRFPKANMLSTRGVERARESAWSAMRVGGAKVDIPPPIKPGVPPVQIGPSPGAIQAIKADTAAGGPQSGQFPTTDTDRLELRRWISEGIYGEREIYRGLGFPSEVWAREIFPRLKVGEVFPSRELSMSFGRAFPAHLRGRLDSWTKDPSRVFGFTKGDVAVRLRTSQLNRARDVSPWSLFPEEQEVLAFERKFQVTKIEMVNPGQWDIWIQEVIEDVVQTGV